MRQLSSKAKPTFYPCTVLGQTLPLPEGALNGRPRYNLVVDEVVKKPTNQTNKKH